MTTLKKWRLPICSRGQARLLIVGFLAFFFLGVGGVNASTGYTLVRSEDFTNQPDGPLASSWEQTHFSGAIQNTRSISGGKAITTGNRWENSILLRPITENFLNGKIEFVGEFGENNPIFLPYARLRGPITNASYGGARIRKNGDLYYTIAANISIPNGAATGPRTGPAVPKMIRGEMIIHSLDETTTQMIINVYSGDTEELIRTHTITNTTPAFQSAGQWGITAYYPVSLSKIALYKTRDILNTALTLSLENVKIGETIGYTLTTTEENDNVVLSDNGAGGTFDTTTIILHSGNNWTATGTHTPNQVGTISLTANFASMGAKTKEIFVSPYATTIGFIGDSVTKGTNVQTALQNLGRGFVGINAGVGGATANNWANDNHSSTPIFTNALQMFTGVEIVHIMLGTNEAAQNVSSGVYKANMQTLITNLKNADFKHVLISNPPYIDNSNLNSGDTTGIKNENLLSYQLANFELIQENSGFVVLGDSQAYEYFSSHTGELANDYHPNSLGYTHLGEFWSEAIKSALEYQIDPDANFSGATTYIKGTTGNLTFRVDKWIEEFSGVIVSGTVLTSGTDYTLTEGSTIIMLEDDYLKDLSAGNYTLTASFYGGVNVNSTFTIVDAPIPQCTNGATNYPACNNNQIISPTSSGGGGGGTSLKADSCPAGDLSASYYDGTCGTTADLASLVEAKVNILRPLIHLIYITATEKEKVLVHDIITSCSQTNKKEVIKLACQELVATWDF